MANKPICSVEGCGNIVKSNGLCPRHWIRWKRHGDPLTGVELGRPMKFVEDALGFAGKECLSWPFSRRSGGYGRISVGGKGLLAHRFICERAHGPAPSPDHEAAHNCGKGHLGCVNPNHLEWKTPTQNQADRLEHGTDNRGHRNGSAKLSVLQVIEIRQLRGLVRHVDIAEMYGISLGSVSHIMNRKTWAHIDG